MSKYILKKRIFAIVFIVAVFGFSAVNFYHGYVAIGDACAHKKAKYRITVLSDLLKIVE